MKKLLISVGIVALGVAGAVWAYGEYGPQTNPDPNHTHADFAVWVNGKQMDFSADKYMSGLSTDADTHPTEGPRKYLHLHDGNGHVIHRHKPGMTLEDFFSSLTEPKINDIRLESRTENGRTYTQFWFCTLPKEETELEWYCDATTVRLFVNGVETPEGADYVFKDGDQLLITASTNDDEVQREISLLSENACKYSKTCPWKGTPPTENCIADPTVPCSL